MQTNTDTLQENICKIIQKFRKIYAITIANTGKHQMQIACVI